MPLQVPCPVCKKVFPYEGNPHRPFCSERCKLIDLGTWAEGGYVVEGKNREIEEENISASDKPSNDLL